MGRLVESLDSRVDAAFESLRGRPLVDALASAASFLGDHGLVWFLLCLVRARSPSHRSTALRALLYTGALSPPLNAALKAAFGRVRPHTDGARHGLVRIPRTSSFPSGHTLAAWCAATVLADGDSLAPAYYGLAAAISLSRIHLRVHHASDVAAGALLGVALGRAGRIWRRS